MLRLKINRILTVLFVLSILSGCATNYLYTSRGNLQYSSGEQRPAVLYWRSDEGRTWYLAPYNKPDSDVALSVCGNASSSDFVPVDDSSTYHLVTKSKAMDAKVGELTADGKLLKLDKPVLLKDGSQCGRILLGNEPANINELHPGEVLEIVFWCKNDTRPDRYPVQKIYQFGEIFKTKTKAGEGQAPDPCDHSGQ